MLFFCGVCVHGRAHVGVCVCFGKRCSIKQAHETASLKSMQSWDIAALFLSQARLKLSPSYCSKGTVWLLVSHLWALSVCVCVLCVHLGVWYCPPGIPFLYPTDFRAALKFLLRGNEEREKGGGGLTETKSGRGGGRRVKMLHFYSCTHSAHRQTVSFIIQEWCHRLHGAF